MFLSGVVEDEEPHYPYASAPCRSLPMPSTVNVPPVMGVDAQRVTPCGNGAKKIQRWVKWLSLRKYFEKVICYPTF